MDMQFNTCLIVPKRGKKDAVMSSRRIMSRIYYTLREKLSLKNFSTCAIKKMDEDAILPYTSKNCAFHRILPEI